MFKKILGIVILLAIFAPVAVIFAKEIGVLVFFCGIAGSIVFAVLFLIALGLLID